MPALTTLLGSFIFALTGCHQGSTRVLVDDNCSITGGASAAPGGAATTAVALGASRDLDVDSRPDRLSVMSFNMHHKDRPRDLSLMASRLRSDVAEVPDFVLLQEVVFDRSTVKGEENTAAVLANDLDFYCRGTKRDGDREGIALISRYPFLYYAERRLKHQTSRLLLGFNRVSVMGEFNVPDIGRVRVVNVHFTNWGFEEHVRRGQLQETLEWVAQRQRTVPADLIIFGGDFNIEPDWDELSVMYDTSVTGGIEYRSHNDPRLKTFGSTGAADKRVDYVFIAEPGKPTGVMFLNEQAMWPSGIRQTDSSQVVHLSDHLAMLQEYRLEGGSQRVPSFAGAE